MHFDESRAHSVKSEMLKKWGVPILDSSRPIQHVHYQKAAAPVKNVKETLNLSEDQYQQQTKLVIDFLDADAD